ncbi:spore coat protein Y [Siminovitchia terrae]|uniref:Spore coat protein Y n=1 Tax=Siminovitchia terrae TaxID=1914933 RepID=A0A429X082_SIMTE|nr:CotY/CotZ family spore coat protein [Siminovitchia terrae]RST56914.1 hypothetical protein D5F11_025565 [Siminovitchia terrae]GIN94287.1 spore coat protein Y [Siminovitchia terrae]
MDKKNCICIAMKTLQKEQSIISGQHMEFQFVCMSTTTDTIPFMLFMKNNQKPLKAFTQCIVTPFFRLEKLDEETCCAELSLLEAIDMDGNPINSFDDDMYSLRKTKSCITVDLNCFCAINPLPPNLVNRPLLVIEPKY